MTPLAAVVCRLLPRVLRVPALAVIYSLALLAILLVGDTELANLVYVDAGRGR